MCSSDLVFAGFLRTRPGPHHAIWHAAAARGRAAYLPERFKPPHYLTGRDFLRYVAGLHRTVYDETAAIALLQEIDLDTATLGKPVRAYSKGMNQKLGLAVCILSRKDLLILDERSSGLDPRAHPVETKTESPVRRGHHAFFTSHARSEEHHV